MRPPLPRQAAVIYRNRLSGPRFAGVSRAVRDRIWDDPRLRLIEEQVDRGLLSETYRFVVEGSEDAVADLEGALVNTVDRWATA